MCNQHSHFLHCTVLQVSKDELRAGPFRLPAHGQEYRRPQDSRVQCRNERAPHRREVQRIFPVARRRRGRARRRGQGRQRRRDQGVGLLAGGVQEASTQDRSLSPPVDVVLLRHPADRQNVDRHPGHLRAGRRHQPRRPAIFLVDDHLLHHLSCRGVSVELLAAEMVDRQVVELVHALLGYVSILRRRSGLADRFEQVSWCYASAPARTGLNSWRSEPCRVSSSAPSAPASS